MTCPAPVIHNILFSGDASFRNAYFATAGATRGSSVDWRSEERRVGKECRCGRAAEDSSRRRHTRWTGDWSSHVCSSDLATTSMRLEPTLGLGEKALATIVDGDDVPRASHPQYPFLR